MESHKSISQNQKSLESESVTTSCHTKDFIDQLKDFLNDTLIELQQQEKIPPITFSSKPNTPKGRKVSFQGQGTKKSVTQIDINWEFDAKDTNWEKYGNFSTPTVMKLVSKYNKTQKTNQQNEA